MVNTETIMTPDRAIKSICLIFIVIFTVNLASEFSFIQFLFKDEHSKWDSSIPIVLLPLLYIPLATILFYKRKKAGWFLLSVFLSYTISSAIYFVYLALFYKPSGLAALDNLFPPPSSGIELGKIFIFGLLLSALFRKDVREIYSADQKNMISSMIIGILITLGLATGIFM